MRRSNYAMIKMISLNYENEPSGWSGVLSSQPIRKKKSHATAYLVVIPTEASLTG